MLPVLMVLLASLSGVFGDEHLPQSTAETPVEWFCDRYEPAPWTEGPWLQKPGYTVWYLVGDALLVVVLLAIWSPKQGAPSQSCAPLIGKVLGFGFIVVDGTLHVVGERLLFILPWSIFTIALAVTLVGFTIWLLVDECRSSSPRGRQLCYLSSAFSCAAITYMVGAVTATVGGRVACESPEGAEFPYAEHAATHGFLLLFSVVCLSCGRKAGADGDAEAVLEVS